MLRQMARHFLLLAVILLPGGCSRQAPSSPPPAAAPPADADSPLRQPPRPAPHNVQTLLAAGTLPLFHLAESGGSLRVMNATSGKTLATLSVPPRSVVALDAAAGLMVGSRKLIPGPLPRDHRYEIWWDPMPPRRPDPPTAESAPPAPQ